MEAVADDSLQRLQARRIGFRQLLEIKSDDATIYLWFGLKASAGTVQNGIGFCLKLNKYGQLPECF